jgi:sialate O-acetylesterase
MKGIVFLLVVAAALRADVSLAPLFQDGAVLQREKPVPVWGWAAPGERVHVIMEATRISTTADEAGRWMVRLEPRPASAVPRELVAEGSNRVVIRDVVIGDVWLCSGQSNMKMSAQSARDATREAAVAQHPLIRQFKVKPNFAATPRETLGGAWERCTPATFGGFSAAAVFFARAVWRDLGIPIGLLNSAYGNTPIASWRDPRAVGAEPIVQVWWEQELTANTPPRPHRAPSSCYNGMIHPLAPYALRGILWYQGESDASEAATLAPIYGRQFTGLIQEWRGNFAQPELPFFWVQLAGYGLAGPRAWREVRAAQASALSLPNTGQAVAIDVGEQADIHPKNKQAVGERLARLALNRVCGRKIEDSGPDPVQITRTGNAVRVRFDHAGGGLSAQGDLAQAFELAGPDGGFAQAAEVRIEGDAITVRAAGVAAPSMVRFGWQYLPHGFLVNREGLPAAPFTLAIP